MKPVPCRSCQQPILWLENTLTGKRAPIDAEPAEGGNIAVSGSTYAVLSKEAVALAVSEGARLHKSHFATCKFAKQHRKPA